MDNMLGLIVIGFLLLMIVGVFFLLYILQKRFLDVCKETNNLQLYTQTPFGVPAGTIRSILALSIVFASICYIAITVLYSETTTFPEVMGGILGSVLGFYFGSRGSVGRANEDVLQQLNKTSRDRDDAVNNLNKGKLSTVIAQAKAGVAAVKAIRKVLPEQEVKKLNSIINAVNIGINAAEGLAGSGKTAEAIAEIGKSVEKLKENNPMQTVLSSAVGSFGSILSTAFPPLAIATIVIGIGSKLAGAAYQRWVARVLAAPYTPELFPPTVIDSAVAMSIARSSPIFSRAFDKEIKAGNLEYIRNLVRQALSDTADKSFWSKPDIANRFTDLAELDEGIKQIQLAAMTEEVLKDIDPAEMEPVGGTDQFMEAIDKINANENAQKDLDSLVLMMNELKKENQPVQQIFSEALDSVDIEAST
jgi:hypothetical protein